LLDYGHISCIKKCPASKNDPIGIMWLLPSHADFVLDGEILGGIGKLRDGLFREMQSLASVLLKRAALPTFRGIVLASELTKTLNLLLYRLEFASTTFRTMQVSVCETQRVYLGLRALLDFQEIFRPRMAESTSVTAVDPGIIGCFTNNLGVCDTLFRAGIPVWLIRPYTDLPSIRIRALTPLIRANGTIPLDFPYSLSHRPIYVGAGNKLEKYMATARYICKLLEFPDPFGSVRAELLVEPPLPSSQPSDHRNSSSSRRFTPCNAPSPPYSSMANFGSRQ
jgi:hypothetical protein